MEPESRLHKSHISKTFQDLSKIAHISTGTIDEIVFDSIRYRIEYRHETETEVHGALFTYDTEQKSNLVEHFTLCRLSGAVKDGDIMMDILGCCCRRSGHLRRNFCAPRCHEERNHP